MQLQFSTVSEPTIAGEKWKRLCDAFWPGYKSWFLSDTSSSTPDLKTSQEALKKYMPKFWLTYQHLCKLTDADDDLARFLTGFQPPKYHSACAQAVIDSDEIQLVRNYDYHPDLFEGTLLMSQWNDQKVIAISDCLIGVVDGMNDAGLCLSLTFGGRKEIGVGFGIPFILRYVLEFASTTAAAVKLLKSIPSHMSYNVTVVDKKGITKTVMLAPDKDPSISKTAFATNHQGKVDWRENAQFNQTLMRYDFIKTYLKSKNISSGELTKAFLHPPLYNTKFTEGFGTLYTSVYQPEKLRMQLLWPSVSLERSFDHFPEDKLVIYYNDESYVTSSAINQHVDNSYRWQDAVVDSLVKSTAKTVSKSKQKELRNTLMPNGKVAWDAIANYWNAPANNQHK
jgi:predicted choloylglycine hydrolase